MSDTADGTPTHEAGSLPPSLGAARLRGLSHPLRVRIFTLLQSQGSMTASLLAEKLGESSGSTSYHLRQLARHGFVTEVDGKGTARERWWQSIPGGFSVAPEATDDAGTRSAKSMVNAEFERARQENIWRILRAMDTDIEANPLYADWRNAVTLSTLSLTARPEQVEQLISRIHAFIDEQLAPLREQQDVPGARPVQIHFNAFPVPDDA
ncbi:winged helix-turn-helix domain-containing protein [Microbacterium amylolyticum]|uniref:DNA-binding transcriptional ArsR family regulator n=1 Tax=Microbacterium amylolyticum TaxID=936337 RepID=A0ABS4ZGN0_9MICO|nr:helix-turn-helix domain-containing protein [Microbacterium amylolyticum]MBP2436203.1 DNA-binding transcriptional ArsR family regulator [Microbacterium amylolyticum]